MKSLQRAAFYHLGVVVQSVTLTYVATKAPLRRHTSCYRLQVYDRNDFIKERSAQGCHTRMFSPHVYLVFVHIRRSVYFGIHQRCQQHRGHPEAFTAANIESCAARPNS
jgi:hypothetical protein